MGYIDFNDKNYRKEQDIKDFCRWVNMKAVFKSCNWQEYKKRKDSKQ